MAASYSAAIRRARLDAITTAAGANALIRIYGGARPATGGTATTLLAELTGAATLAAAATGSDGGTVSMALNDVTQDPSANNGGTATWFRIVKSDGTTFIMDGDVGTSGAQLNLTTTAIAAGQPVSISNGTFTEGNP